MNDIITAAAAKSLADKHNELQNNGQLSTILQHISIAAQKGMYYFDMESHLSDSTSKYLIYLGFKVSTYSWRNEDYTKISWR